MDALEVLTSQEPSIARHVPCDMTGIGHDLRIGRLGNKPTFRLVEIALVGERKLGLLTVAQLDCKRRRRLSEGVEVLGSTHPAVRRKQRGTRCLALCAD